MIPKIDTILIIEDDPGLIELINEKIQEYGYPTICFQTAATAFGWLENNTPALMLLDYSLPDMNAQEFIAVLKKKNKTIPPFIVATGQGDERIAVEMMKLGAKEYIIKDTHFLEMIPFVVSKSISEIEKDRKLLLTEQKIVELSQFNKQIIASAHEGIVVYDKELNYLTWNPFMEKITGIMAIELIGKNAIELFPFLQDTGEIRNIKRAIEEKKITESEFKYNISSTGKFGWASQTTGPLFNFEGEVIGAIATVHDVTTRKKAEEDLRFSEEKFRSITEQINDYISISDVNGIIFYASPASKTMFQYEPNEMTGHHFMDFIDEAYLQKAVDAFQNGISEKRKAVNLELRLKRKDGSTFFGELNGGKIEFGDETRVLVVVHDITERKKAEMALELTKQSYVDIINSVSEAIYVLDENATFIDINKGAREMFQLSNEELIGKKPTAVAAPGLNNLKRIQKLLQSVFKTSVPATFEFWAVRKNGEIFPKEVIVNKGRYFEKDVLVATARDTTERKAAQHEIDKIGKHYQALIENAPDGIVLISADNQYKYASPSARRIFGYAPTEEFLKQPNDFIHPDDLNEVLLNLSKILANPTLVSTIEYRILNKTGNWKWIETTFTNLLADPTVAAIVLNFRDITERKSAEKALQSSEEKYRSITENISDVVWISDLNFNLSYISPSASKMYRTSESELILLYKLEKRFPPDSIVIIQKRLAEELGRENDPTWDKKRIIIAEMEHYRADGSTFMAEMRLSFLRDEYENIIGFQGLTRDITERIAAENALKRSEEKYRQITENISDVVWTSDLQFNLNFISSSVEKMIGETAEKHLYRSVREKFSPSSLAKIVSEFNLEFEKEKDPNIKKDRIQTIEVEHYRADGSIFWAEMRMSFLRDEASNITGLLGVTRDISERKQAEMQINKLNDCFLTFGSNPKENINQLVKVCGELFNGTCAVYNRLKEGKISIFGSWNIPENIELTVHQQGNICAKVIHEKSDNIQIFRNLKNSEFAATDPNILQMGIDTCIGKTVKFGKDNAAALCVLFENDYSPSKNEIHLLEIIASAIGVEEERMQVQKVLEVSEEKYRTIIEYSNDWIWMLDKNGYFTFINKTIEKATELNAEDWIGKSFIPLALEEDLPMLTDIFQRSLNGEVCTYELRFRKLDASILTILVNTSPIYEQNLIIGMISFGQDITERKKAEKALVESEMLYRNLVQRIPDGVYKSTAEGKFVDVNPAMVKMLGYESKEDMLSIDIKKELYFEESHRDSNVLNPNNEEKAVFELRKKDGSGIWVEDHGWYNFDETGRKISNEGVLRDITERKKAEEALTEKMDELMRFHRLMVGRELTMIELKKEVNHLLRKAGEINKYKIVE
jgi:PAS domain S-box-containing protein